MQPSDETAAELYVRLLAGEPDAPADVVETFLEPLIGALGRKFPSLPDPTLVDSMVIDAVLSFVKDPGRYRPERSRLWSYLYMVAARDLINALEGERRRRDREMPLTDDSEGVELRTADRNRIYGTEGVDEIVMRRLAPEGLPDHVTIDEVRSEIEGAFPAAQDRAMLELLVAGARKTEDYARVLGIGSFPEDEQRRQVKKAKDRIQVRLKRIGARLNAKPGS